MRGCQEAFGIEWLPGNVTMSGSGFLRVKEGKRYTKVTGLYERVNECQNIFRKRGPVRRGKEESNKKNKSRTKNVDEIWRISKLH